jgi:hypothetical protein
MLADAGVFFKPGLLHNGHPLPVCQTVLTASNHQQAMSGQSYHADGADQPAATLPNKH